MEKQLMSFTQLVKLANTNGYQQIYGYIVAAENRKLTEPKRHASKRICNAIRHALAKRLNVKEM